MEDKLIHRDLEIAATIQRQLLPKPPRNPEKLAFSWEFRPSVYVGGDMLGAIPLNQDFYAVYILDVMGHGVAAALKAVAISCYLLGYNSNALSPSQTLFSLNQQLGNDQVYSYFTIFYGVINLKTRQLTYSIAGHCPPIILSKGKEPCIQERGGPAIGFNQNVNYQEHKITLQVGDRLFLYTDGFIEAENDLRERYSKKRLINWLTHHQNLLLKSLTREAVEEVMIFLGEQEAKDDIAVLAIELI